jgi:hypothetical protein
MLTFGEKKGFTTPWMSHLLGSLGSLVLYSKCTPIEHPSLKNLPLVCVHEPCLGKRRETKSKRSAYNHEQAP